MLEVIVVIAVCLEFCVVNIEIPSSDLDVVQGLREFGQRC